jgi:cysteinyl-tRNA synthetase
MAIKIYNTMTRRKEELVPREAGRITMYVCGPTVYNYIHIGNARTFLNFDVIRRYLEYSGFEVEFIQNITDVDDKIINKADEEGVTPGDLADAYRQAFELDMADLGVKPPTLAPRATGHISEMVEVIKSLVEKGFAYEADGDVYFEVEKFAGYGRLSGRNLDEQRQTLACDISAEPRKRGQWDFALWKAAKPGEPSWDSPWGPGRPGWHIECSTMSTKYLGETFDIHGGGLDLVFPHHENEIAQAEASTGQTFVRYWMHSGMLNIDMEKMSKSLGNIKSCREVLTEHDAETVRMLMLGTHYRGPLNFSDDSLADASAQLERINNCRFNLADAVKRAEGAGTGPESQRDSALGETLDASLVSFREQMDDDFNTAAAIGVLFEVVRDINTYVAEHAGGAAAPSERLLLECVMTLDEMFQAVGLFQTAYGTTAAPGEEISRTVRPVPVGPTREQLVDLLLEVRQAARQMKSFELADRIRDELAALDVRVEDVPGGYRWRFER